MVPVSALAGLSTSLIAAFQGIVTDMLSLITGLLPVGLSIFAVLAGIKLAKHFFKDSTKG